MSLRAVASGSGGGGSGNVVGPASAVDGAPVVFDGTTGKLIKQGSGTGITYSALTYTTAGTVAAEPILALAPPSPYQAGGVVADYSGKWASVVVVPIQNQKLTSIEFTDLQGMTASASITGLSSLTTLSFPALTTAAQASITVGTLVALTTLSLPELAFVGQSFSPTTMAVLTTLSAPKLVYVGNTFNPSIMALVTTFNFPLLMTVAGSVSPGTMAALTALSLPALVSVGGGFGPTTMGAVTTISLALLANVGGAFGPVTMASLVTCTLPSIEIIGGNITAGTALGFVTATAALTTFTLGSTLKQVGNGAGNVLFTSCALNQASVDNILVRLAALDGTGGTTAFSNRTVTITGTSATPSATGLAAKATLVSRSCVVTNN